MVAAMVGCSFAATYCDHDLISMAFGAGVCRGSMYRLANNGPDIAASNIPKFCRELLETRR
jgi:hypothetical protein